MKTLEEALNQTAWMVAYVDRHPIRGYVGKRFWFDTYEDAVAWRDKQPYGPVFFISQHNLTKEF